MSDRREEVDGVDEHSSVGDSPAPSSAGPANMPSFEGEESTARGEETGRPPSHREVQQGVTDGEAGSQEPLEAIARAEAEGWTESDEPSSQYRSDEPGDDEEWTSARSRAEEEAERAADRLQDAARLMDEGVRRATTFGERAAETLRLNEAGGVRDRLERQVREHPLQTLLIAVATGWLVGKILR